MSRIPPAPGSSSRTAGLPSNPDMRQAFPSDAFTSSSGGGGGGPYPPAQAQRASPRRPTRSVRRPNHSATPSTSSIPPPPTHSDDRDFTRSPSPEGITRRPTWEEERTEREHQVASVPSPSGSDVFRKAQVGKAFASSGRDRQNSYETEKSKKGKEVREMDPDLQGDFGGQFKGIDSTSPPPFPVSSSRTRCSLRLIWHAWIFQRSCSGSGPITRSSWTPRCVVRFRCL